MQANSSTWRAALAALVVVASALAMAGASAGGHAFVTNQEGGIIVVALDTLAPVGVIDVQAKVPRGIGVTQDGKHLITANRDGGDISVIDIAQRKVIRHIAIGKNPEFVRVRGDYAYVSYEPSAKAGPPKANADDDDDDEGSKLPAGIAVIDLKRWELVRTIMSGPETEGIEFSSDGKHMLVTNEGDNSITVYQLADGKLVKTIDTHKLGDRPRGIKISPDGNTYAVTLEWGDKLLLLDRNFEPIKTIPTAKGPYGVTFDREGKRLLVAAFKDKQLQVFDAKTYALLKSIPIGERCWHFSFTPDDSKLLVASVRSNELLVFDATNYQLLKRLSDKSLPWGVVTYPKAMGSLDQPSAM